MAASRRMCCVSSSPRSSSLSGASRPSRARVCTPAARRAHRATSPPELPGAASSLSTRSVTTPELSQLSSAIKQHAPTLGFDACGIAPCHRSAGTSRSSEDLAGMGHAGKSMTFLEKSADLRDDARGVLPSAQSVIVTATVYNTDRP